MADYPGRTVWMNSPFEASRHSCQPFDAGPCHVPFLKSARSGLKCPMTALAAPLGVLNGLPFHGGETTVSLPVLDESFQKA